jgi:predicted class III extradiol MEMO1 family dioxygenase
LKVDGEISREIMSSSGKRGDWEWMEREVDEAEHSIEMHAAYVRKVFEG